MEREPRTRSETKAAREADEAAIRRGLESEKEDRQRYMDQRAGIIPLSEIQIIMREIYNDDWEEEPVHWSKEELPSR